MIKRLGRFVRKYDFPLHFFVIFNQHFIRRVSVWMSTFLFKFRLEIFRCKYGKNLIIDGIPVIELARCGSISFGDNCVINSRFKSNLVGKANPMVFECRNDGSITIGNYTGLSFAVISSRIGIVIGNNVKVGGNVRIFDHDYHSLNYLDRRVGQSDQQNARSAPIQIGDDVFIGTNTIILKGVAIGNRAIIGAGSVVGCDIPSDEIWGGNPVRCLKKGKAVL